MKKRKAAREALAEVLIDLRAHIEWDDGLLIDGNRFEDANARTALRDLVYARHFCRWSPGSRRSTYVSGNPSFVHQLALATGGARYWEHGWTVVQVGDGWRFVRDHRLTLFVDDPAAIWPPEPPVGAPASVLVPCARPDLAPGFFYLMGQHGPFRRDAPYLRFYLNITPEAAPHLIMALLDRFREPAIRFEAKVANDPEAYGRVDPAIVYTDQEGYATAKAALLAFTKRMKPWWRTGTPLFTHELAPGLSSAECPALEPGVLLESFGHHRCGLVAEGLLSAFRARDENWLGHVGEAFERSGLTLDRPYAETLPGDWL